jgi:protein-disulfide isomerase
MADRLRARRQKRLIWGLCCTTLFSAFSGSVAARIRLKPQKKSGKKLVYAVPIGSAPVKGPKTALVTVIAYMDFQCPFCKKAIERLLNIQKSMSKDMRVVFKHRPLRFHRQAHTAAQAAVEAQRQNKFWSYMALLFKNHRNLGVSQLIKLGTQAKLNGKKLKKALSTQKHKSAVDRDNREALKFGVKGTPTMFINGVKMVGARPQSTMLAEIKKQMRVAKKVLKKKGVTRKNLYARLIKGGIKKSSKMAKRYIAVSRKHGTAAGTKIPSRHLKAPSLRTKSAQIKKKKSLTFADRPSLGPHRAPLTIVWFTNQNCYGARRMFRAWSHISQRYAGKVRLVFKHHITKSGDKGFFSAMVLEEAYAQGLFWAMLRQFVGTRMYRKNKVLELAESMGMDMKKLAHALKTKKHESRVKRDLAEAKGNLRYQSRCNVALLPNGQELYGYISGYSLGYKVAAALRMVTPAGMLMRLP